MGLILGPFVFILYTLCKGPSAADGWKIHLTHMGWHVIVNPFVWIGPFPFVLLLKVSFYSMFLAGLAISAYLIPVTIDVYSWSFQASIRVCPNIPDLLPAVTAHSIMDHGLSMIIYELPEMLLFFCWRREQELQKERLKAKEEERKREAKPFAKSKSKDSVSRKRQVETAQEE